MRYFGGKQKIARFLAKVIEGYCPFVSYWEPFCGVCSVMERIECSQRVASDIHPDLILMWKALQDGWMPPRVLSEEDYRDLKFESPSPLRAFAGFGCSNSGRWFEGYARDKTGRNYASNAKNSLSRKIEKLRDAEFHKCSYVDFDTSHLQPPILVYCDPPYAQSTKRFNSGVFDSNAFWDWARLQSQDSTVVISEYSAPEDFVEIWEKRVKTDLKKADGTKYCRTEKLFVHSSSL